MGLAACSGTESGNSKPAQPEASSTVDVQKLLDTPTELKLVSPGLSEELFNQRFGDQLRKKFPKYTFTFIKTDANTYKDLVATNQSFDLLLASSTGMAVYLLDYKLESDISDLIKKYKFDLSRIQQAPLDMQKQLGNGAIYGFPWTITPLVHIYNKDLFNKFGVAYPQSGITWDQLYDKARQMSRTDSGVKYRGLTMAFDHMMGLNQLGASYYDPKTFKATYSDDLFKKVFDNAARFWKLPGNEPTANKYSLGEVRDSFNKAQVTAMHLDVAGFAQIASTTMTNWELATFPVFADKPNIASSVLPDFSFITNKSANRDAAFQVLAYTVSDEYQQWMASTLMLLPALAKPEQAMKTFGDNIPGVKGKNVQAITANAFAPMQPFTPYYSLSATEMVAAINDYMAGKDTNTVLREAAERVDKKIADLRK
jgi:multiple sugar transport system substrate-binding protein